jgi:tetrapyrrole methylase family protein/MazG family protein
VGKAEQIATEGELGALLSVIRRLRGRNGCPWDRKQTPRSMTPYVIEESYELVDAIEAGRHADVCEELGDVLFHILFLIEIFSENKQFDMTDVIGGIRRKMIRRHPHVFGDRKVDSSEAVRKQWRDIKKAEKRDQPPASVLDSIPNGLPALARAYRVSERAVGEGFEWPDLDGVLDQAEEEWREFKEELERRSTAVDDHQLKLEFGDVLFTLVNVARVAKIHPETSLVGAIAKFERRFRLMEKLAAGEGMALAETARNDMEDLWERAKIILAGEESP